MVSHWRLVTLLRVDWQKKQASKCAEHSEKVPGAEFEFQPHVALSSMVFVEVHSLFLLIAFALRASGDFCVQKEDNFLPRLLLQSLSLSHRLVACKIQLCCSGML